MAAMQGLFLLLLALSFHPNEVSGGKTLECSSGKVILGCQCVERKAAINLAEGWRKLDKKRAQTAIVVYEDSMKKYARAWEVYSAYMRISANCRRTWKRTYRYWRQWRALLIKSRRYIRRCDGLRSDLLRTLRYKKRFEGRIKFQTAWRKQNDKLSKEMSANIAAVKDYINDSCRFMHTLFVHHKTVAWTASQAAQRKIARLKVILKPLLKTLAAQRKQFRSQCDRASLKVKWAKFRKARFAARNTKRLYMRFKRCTWKAEQYAQIQVQSKMIALREQAKQSKVIYLRYLRKIALDRFNLCVTKKGLAACDQSKLFYTSRDDSQKLFKKLTKSLHNEYLGMQSYYAKHLAQKWRDLRRKEGF